ENEDEEHADSLVRLDVGPYGTPDENEDEEHADSLVRLDVGPYGTPDVGETSIPVIDDRGNRMVTKEDKDVPLTSLGWIKRKSKCVPEDKSLVKGTGDTIMRSLGHSLKRHSNLMILLMIQHLDVPTWLLSSSSKDTWR
nr:hypothetical protein [Tanacetum cinerariifolium]